MKSVPRPVDALILICEKCGSKLALPESNENPSRILQKAFKELAKKEHQAQPGGARVRPVVTSCLSICPDGEIALGVIHLGKEDRFFTTVRPETPDEVEALWRQLGKSES